MRALFSVRALFFSLFIMGTTQDPYILKEHTEFYEILKFRAVGPILNKIQPFQNLLIY